MVNACESMEDAKQAVDATRRKKSRSYDRWCSRAQAWR